MNEWKPGAKLPDPVRRPPHELHNYPIDMRWEFVRRHPFYVEYWQEVRRFYDTSSHDPQERKEFGFRAKLLFGGIGVYGPPVSPDSTVEEILEGNDPSLLSGSLQPMSLRMMASLLVQHLDPDSKAFFCQLLLQTANAASRPEGPPHELQRVISAAVHCVTEAPLPGFDQFADDPLFFMHLGASLNAIQADALDQAKRWKKRKGIADPPKIRKDKHADYLYVWDLREGWTGGGYDRGTELKLREIAKRLGEPISTVTSKYKQAFRLVVGVDFSPELWLQVFGQLKLHDLFLTGPRNKPAGVKRRILTAPRRPVPVANLGGEPGAKESYGAGSGQTLLESVPAPEEEPDYRQKLDDFRSMVAKGRTDHWISEELEMDLDKVKNLRDHLEDFKDL